ncbi:hypothetical protein GCM10009715_36240 [Paeniglutamicibacter psychrophenolicus]|uniref:Outer membrane protein OmpA-like peptidoglycan-associated protein n=1 Tax=Paeniglutamicibacter psychrophenolicus TaxID=257454 RepID=A0ABS4WAK8_9MICC|nr:OmpA family protein [Paeniglutamicibacter psychrophenolicus]MBP2373210.1 outer membrane protein OmpA-like peptidoglycan-associated protein [Paeniglutamicibacter psychrophenolicus]
MTATPRRIAAVALLAAVLGLQLVPAQAAGTGPQDLPEPTGEMLDKSVRAWDPAGSVRIWDLSGSVKDVDEVKTKGKETTISLSTDILFTPDSSTLPDSVSAKVEALVAKVPRGASVKVNGHTDSVKGTIDNKVLSTDRAKAVAAVLKKVRPDLELKVKGLAATEPAVREDADDPSSFAANRRVEIIFAN